MKLVKDTDNNNLETKKVSDKEAEEAIRTISVSYTHLRAHET